MEPAADSTLQLQRLLIEHSPDAMVLCAADDTVLLWNPGAEQLFGYQVANAVGRRWCDLVVPPGGAEAELARRHFALERDVTARAVLRQRQDGVLLHADSALRAVRGADGGVVGYVVAERDVTALTVARDTRLLGERYRDLLESVPDAIVIANEIGRIVLFNSHAETMFGCPRAEMLGRPIEALLPARFGAAHVAHRLRYRERPQVRQMGAGLQLFGRRHDGREFPVEISLSPLASADGHYVMSAIRDTSRQKQVEQALQDKNIELTVASQAKDRFLATMSHELRTPLNAILGFSGLMLMQRPGPLNAEQQRQLGIVRHSGEQLLTLIEQLLALAKLQSGAPTLAPEPVDLALLLRELAVALTPAAERDGRRIDLDLPPRPAIVTADRLALERLLKTLAAETLRERGDSITLALRAADDGAAEIAIGPMHQAAAGPAPCSGDGHDRRSLGVELAGRLAEHVGATLRCTRGAGFTLHWGDAADDDTDPETGGDAAAT